MNANHFSPDIKTNCLSDITAVRYGQNMDFCDKQSFPTLNVRFLKSCQTPLRVMLNLSMYDVPGQKVSLIQKFISFGFWFTKIHLICIKDLVTFISWWSNCTTVDNWPWPTSLLVCENHQFVSSCKVLLY